MIDAVLQPRDPVFGEILEGILQLTAMRCVELVAWSSGAKHVVATALNDGVDESPGILAASVPVPVGGGEVHLRLYDHHPSAALPDSVHVIGRMIGRLLEERRAARLSRDEPRGLVVVRNDGQLRVVSPLVASLTGYEPSDAVGRNVFDHIHADDHDIAVDSLARTSSFPGEKYPLDVRFLCRDGTSCLLEVTAEHRQDVTLDDVVFAVRPVDQRHGDDALAGDQWRVLDMIGRGERLETTLDEIARLAARRLGAGCAVMISAPHEPMLRVVASDGIATDVVAALHNTPIAPQANACGAATYRGQAINSRDVLSDDSWREMWPVLATHGVGSCWADPILANRSQHALGSLVFLADRGWSPSVEAVRVGDLFASLASVAVQRTQAEAVLQHQAMHDQLTGLPNRALFLDRLEHALARRRGHRAEVAVLFIDLDRFKIINDALGHEAGDELLVAVAARIQMATRTGTTVARFGGDEFTVLADEIHSPSDALQVGERIAAAFRQPLQLGVGDLVMTVSVGIAVSGDDHTQASAMLRDADAAMYRAKHRGRNRVELFDSEMRAEAVARLELVHALQDAVQRNEFDLHYQAEVDLSTLAVVGVEALLRWPHGAGRPLSPAEFIPIAEESGAIVGLGEWVLERACRQLSDWDAVGGASLGRVWVNISATQLLQKGFVDRVKRVLEAAGADSSRLGLEITESALMSDLDAAILSLSKLKDLGVSLAIDDFGTGYASLNYLRRLSVDLVKIDQSFIHAIGREDGHAGGAGRHPGDLAMVGAIINLVHATNARVIAEGVETEGQFRALQSVGCDEAQGFWIGRPGPAMATPPTWHELQRSG